MKSVLDEYESPVRDMMRYHLGWTDDIQDDDRERHHRPTVWTIWGKPQAAHDYLNRAKRELEELDLAAPGNEDLETLMDFLVEQLPPFKRFLSASGQFLMGKLWGG